MNEDWWQPEAELAADLGVTRSTLRAMRSSMEAGTDYAAGPMRFSKSGVKKVCAALGIEPFPDLERKEPEAKKPAVIELMARRFPMNTQIVLCDPECEVGPGQDKRLVRVKVRDSKNFLPGMRLPCRHLQDDLYELARACPRWRGVW